MVGWNEGRDGWWGGQTRGVIGVPIGLLPYFTFLIIAHVESRRMGFLVVRSELVITVHVWLFVSASLSVCLTV